MRVCLLSMEIFAWGKHGGYGRATRIIGRELINRGVEVSAVVPLRGDQRPVEQLDGIRVLGFPRWTPWQAARLLRESNADIYHSQEPSFTTYLAQRTMPERRHLVTLRDTHEWSDWLAELRHPSLNRGQVLANKLFEDNPLVQRAVRRVHRVYCAAEFLRVKAQRKYRLKSTPEFLPTPVSVPHHVRKAERPTVCYLARWDRRKRPELFLALARHFPQIRFIAFGTSRDSEYERGLRARYTALQPRDAWACGSVRVPRHRLRPRRELDPGEHGRPGRAAQLIPRSGGAWLRHPERGGSGRLCLALRRQGGS